MRHHRSRINHVSGLQPSIKFPLDWRVQVEWPEHVNNLRMPGIILETHKRERRVAPDHRIGVTEKLQKRVVKIFRGIVLAHHPRIGDADLVHRIVRELDDLRIPLANGGVASFYACFELSQSMLDVSRVRAVSQSL